MSTIVACQSLNADECETLLGIYLRKLTDDKTPPEDGDDDHLACGVLHKLSSPSSRKLFRIGYGVEDSVLVATSYITEFVIAASVAAMKASPHAALAEIRRLLTELKRCLKDVADVARSDAKLERGAA